MVANHKTIKTVSMSKKKFHSSKALINQKLKKYGGKAYHHKMIKKNYNTIIFWIINSYKYKWDYKT